MVSIQRSHRRQLFAGFTGGICLFICGTWTGWLSPFLKKLQTGESVPFSLTTNEKSWVIALMDLIVVVMAIPSGYIMDMFGRKSTFYITAIFFALSWGLAVFAFNIYVLYAARIFAGISHALTYTAVPIYLGEIAEKNFRGAITGLFTLLLWGGNLFTLTISLLIPFKTVEYIVCIFPIILFVLLFYIPESPHYLLMKNDYKAAYRSHKWLRCLENDENPTSGYSVTNELDQINTQVQKEMESKTRWVDLINTKGTRRATLIVISISIMQRFSGINVMLTYMTTILPSTTKGLNPDICVIIFGLLLMVISLGSMIIIDKVGRKPALYASGIVCAIVQGIIAYYFYTESLNEQNISGMEWIPYVCMLIFAIFYQAGIGTISHTLLGEMFPVNVKGKASAVTNIFFAISTFIIQKSFLILKDVYGVHVIFIVFALSNAFSAIFTYIFVVETKGKSLAEIQDILNK